MARVKRGVTTRAKHKRILDNAKGYYGRRKNTIRIARQAVEKAGQYAYRDRKVKKRSFRALWIQRINAAVRAEGLTYGQFIHALNLAGIGSTARSSPTSRCTRPKRSAPSSPRRRARWRSMRRAKSRPRRLNSSSPRFRGEVAIRRIGGGVPNLSPAKNLSTAYGGPPLPEESRGG